MEFYVERDPFLKALARVQSIVERRNTMPVLGNVLLQAAGGTLTVTATDSELALQTVLPIEAENDGEITLPARKLYEIVRELPDQPIRLRLEAGERVLITSGRARFTLVGIGASMFPALPQPDGNLRFALDSQAMVDMFNKVHFATSQDDGRFVLNGILLQLEPVAPENPQLCLRMVATDSHRLSMAETTVDNAGNDPRDAIMPRKAVMEARKLLEENQGQVELVMGERFLQFIMPGVTMTSKLVEGRFPNWRRVVPEQNVHQLDIDREALLGVVRRMSVLSHEKSRGILMRIGADSLKITTSNLEQEVADEETSAAYAGPDLSLSFNARYLQEILTCVPCDTIRFHLLNNDAPVLVTGVEQGHFLFVLMPMQV
ncbi:MAG: DNA polymerase III subunit beta [Magnetococcales bacterium]|nr:DNA polymerase III subunit beta [Magnetococcales bacterium]